ncbi:AMP-binding protein [Haloarcula sp. 1CSR25-25]|jgi:acetyl-CoA synthetase|uniref:AMP-binding protein n=1 Tax=Haloarcula sp. 1CSR25-25 TaxID=2862545 RepID=UPI002895A3AF|nr:AMP-binding protein [Haloarcula sp. 1CSR25-25]MDT3437207.1 AMP-binding protein [Haloarcula sp. 1CSR25-25]
MASDTLADTEEIVHKPTQAAVESTNVWSFMQAYGIEDYDDLIERTTTDIEGVPASGVDWFWDELVDYLDIEFYEDYDAVRDDADGPQFTDWYPGGSINIAHNVLDRHAARDTERRNSVACLWEGEDGATRNVTYHELHRQSNQVANALRERGIEQGDTVGLYMPMVPEVISILYGCFKVGAIAVPIFSGFGVDATATRIEDSGSSVVFTADGFYRRGSELTLKDTLDEAIETVETDVSSVVVYERTGSDVPWVDGRDEPWTAAVETQADTFETVQLDSTDPSMLLYSSGTTGKPKGIVHTHAGVQMQCAKELHFGFDLKAGDRFFWVSDIGWMMGPWTLIGNHTFGGTVFMYEGAPDYPEPDRFWQMIDRHDLTHFGISPTAIRALRKQGDDWVTDHDLSSLRILGSTGEPWDPESWQWFYEKVGNEDCPIINISGGTEICGCFLMPMPTQPLKPCSLGGPGLGMDIDIVDSDGNSIVDTNERGYLVARDSCPSMTRSLWSGDERYLEEYWSTWDDVWDHGDWAQKDADGFWFLHGRADDALNIAGRKVGPAEVEGAAMDHEAVNQAAAVGVPDDTTGTAVALFVVTDDGETESDDLRNEVRELVGDELGKPFRPREVRFVDEFPVTQSGKIVRRAIQARHTGEDIGDLSSVENPDALDAIDRAR